MVIRYFIMAFSKKILQLFCVLILSILLRNDNVGVADGFVYLEDNHFKIEDNGFFPLMINYIVDFQSSGRDFLVTPSWNYDSCNYIDAVGAEAVGRQLRAHFSLISELGFNTVRICLDRVGFDSDGRCFYQAGRRFYLDRPADVRSVLRGVETVAEVAAEYNLRLMLLIKSPLDKESGLRFFTKALLFHFRNNPVVFAYDFMNEPLYFDPENFRHKSSSLKIVRDWREMMDEYAPHQLFTIGFAEPIEVFEWDCSMLPVDFVEIHTYNPLRIPSEIYWYSKYCGKPWMIGETGLSADNVKVPYDEQVILIREAYKIARDGGCCGFGIWQFFDDLSLSFEGSFTGLLAHGGHTAVNNGSFVVNGFLKPAAAIVASLADNYSPDTLHRPVNYYNMLGYKNIRIKGRVVDAETGDGVDGAAIRGWNDTWKIGMNTYSDGNGCFELYCNTPCAHFEISAAGYTNSKFDTTVVYAALSSGAGTIAGLPEQDVEYHQIDYHCFLKNQFDGTSDFEIFDFDSTLFDKAEWEGNLGTVRLLKMRK